MLRAGKPTCEIRDFYPALWRLRASYDPPFKPVTWIPWLGPALVVLAGLTGIVTMVRAPARLQRGEEDLALSAFWIIAALMTALALYVVLRPLLRGGYFAIRAYCPRSRPSRRRARRAGIRNQRAALTTDGAAPAAPSSRALTLGLALLVPLAAFGIYRQIGDLRALDPTRC